MEVWLILPSLGGRLNADLVGPALESFHGRFDREIVVANSIVNEIESLQCLAKSKDMLLAIVPAQCLGHLLWVSR